MKLGILGGSFDPVHNGHLLMAQYGLEQLGLDRVIFLPAFYPPHKLENKLSSFEHRIKMLELSFDDCEDFEVSTLESMRSGPSYTYDSLQLFTKKYPNAELYFLIGADSLMSLERWYRGEDLLKEFSFAVAPRPGKSREEIMLIIDRLKENYGAKIYLLNSPYVEISSTLIRSRRKVDKSIRYHLPEAVEAYIYEEMLYQKGEKNCIQIPKPSTL